MGGPGCNDSGYGGHVESICADVEVLDGRVDRDSTGNRHASLWTETIAKLDEDIAVVGSQEMTRLAREAHQMQNLPDTTD